MNNYLEEIRKVNVSEIIEMAWCDKTSFDDIEAITGFSEKETIDIMRGNLKPASFRSWRRRVNGRKAKHKKRLHYMADSISSQQDQVHILHY